MPSKAADPVITWRRKHAGCFSFMFSMKAYLQGESLWCFSSLPGDCSAASAALLTDALRHFILLTADSLGDRY